VFLTIEVLPRGYYWLCCCFNVAILFLYCKQQTSTIHAKAGATGMVSETARERREKREERRERERREKREERREKRRETSETHSMSYTGHIIPGSWTHPEDGRLTEKKMEHSVWPHARPGSSHSRAAALSSSLPDTDPLARKRRRR
jgi:hypothetical protein